MSSTEITAIRLNPLGQPDIYRGPKPTSANIYEVVLPLRYTEDGKTYELGKLTIIADLAALQERAIRHAVMLSGAILLLIMLLVLTANGLYQYLVSSRLRGLALELEKITPADLRNFNEQRTPAKASDDEFA